MWTSLLSLPTEQRYCVSDISRCKDNHIRFCFCSLFLSSISFLLFLSLFFILFLFLLLLLLPSSPIFRAFFFLSLSFSQFLRFDYARVEKTGENVSSQPPDPVLAPLEDRELDAYIKILQSGRETER